MKPIITPEEKAEFLTFIGDTARYCVEMAIDVLTGGRILDTDHMSRILAQYPDMGSKIEEFIAELMTRMAEDTTNRLQLILSGNELILEADDGSRTINQHIDFVRSFPGAESIDWSTPGAPTKVQEVEMHELEQPGTLRQIYGGLGLLDQLCLTQGQILQFEDLYPGCFPEKGSGAFFLFRVGGEYLIIRRYRCQNGSLSSYLHSLNEVSEWELHHEPLFVVPKREPVTV